MARSRVRRDRSSRAPIGLDADDIVAAALELLDELGTEGLTTRGLSAKLGVTAPTIYWHVQSMAHLLELVAERVVEEMDLGSRTSGSWDVQLRALMTSARRQLTEHPHIQAVLRETLPRASAEWSKRVLRILQEAGFDDAAAVRYAHVVIWHVLGHAAIEANVRTDDRIMERVPSGANTYRVRPELDDTTRGTAEAALATINIDRHFALTVDLLLSALALELNRPA